MSFSGTVRIGDVDDYIGTELECTKPVEVEPAKKGVVKRIKRNKDGSYSDNKGMTLEKAKITLADCLACAGCVTSAETVLITEQSLDEFISVTLSKRSKVVVTLSPQSRVSLAHRFGVSELDVQRALRGILKEIGVWQLRDLTPFRDLALLEVAKEFLEHKSVPNSGPLLCSACPGFVCYAEKTQGELLVPKMSKVRSPQQISGRSLKRLYKDEDVYHVCIMPCFDKKLEASRQEFQLNDNGKIVKDVDVVLATTEIEKFMVDKIAEKPIEKFIEIGTENNEIIYSHRGGGSGGYLDYIYRTSAKELFGIDVQKNLEFKEVRRNKDFVETTLEIEGEVKLRFAKAYGFRSIQNLVQKLKQKRGVSYDYIEVMACPSGCLNGSAQVRYDDRELNEEILTRITEKYEKTQNYSPMECENQKELFDELVQIERDEIFTSFRILQKDQNALTIKW